MFSAISWFICIQMYFKHINLYQTMYAEHVWCEEDVILLKSSADVSDQGDGAVFVHTEDFELTCQHVQH